MNFLSHTNQLKQILSQSGTSMKGLLPRVEFSVLEARAGYYSCVWAAGRFRVL